MWSMRLRVVLLFALVMTAAAPAVAQYGPRARPPAGSLEAALALTPDQVAAMSPDARLAAASWLWWWKHMGPVAPVQGSVADWIAASRKGTAILRTVIRDAPKDPRAYWMLAEANYDIGELLPEDDIAGRTALYEEMITVARRCITEVDPQNGACWHFYATGKGRLSTTRGLLDSMFEAKEIENAWLKAWKLQPKEILPNGDPMTANIAYGLSVFYRMVPDFWIIKLLIGTRGDIDKSLDYVRKALEIQPWRLELQKELAVALLCRAEKKGSEKNRAEAMAILRRIIAGEFDAGDPRAFNAIDRRHAAELLQRPERACGYSRDGYEDVDVDEVETRIRAQRTVSPKGR